MTRISTAERERYENLLLQNIKGRLDELQKLLATYSDHWHYEDPIYRFYHQSFKVYGLQNATAEIIKALQGLLPDRELNEWFQEIVQAGTGKVFRLEDNGEWLKVTRPILEAFFHARYFLEMACRYGQELQSPPEVLPSGWASLLYVYGLR